MFKNFQFSFTVHRGFVLGYIYAVISHGADTEHTIYLGPFKIVVTHSL